MNSEKFIIKNRHGLKLVIGLDAPENPACLAFIAHGQGGFKEQLHIQAFADAFLENNFLVVRFDATHALGESEGDMIDVTYDSYVEDLEDVINWARAQDWFQHPFALCGHSMGAQSTAWYAEQHPDEVSLLAPMAPTINYDLYIQTMNPTYAKEWEEAGYKETVSRSKPGLRKKVGWEVVESLKNYDLLPMVNKLTMPVLNVVGEFDEPCPADHQKIFMDAVASADKKLVVINGLEHSYRNNQSRQYDQGLEKVEQELSNWLKSHSK